MTNIHQPLEPDLATARPEFTDVFEEHDAEPIPVVPVEEIRASVRSSRVENVVRCDLATVIASLSSLDKGRVAVITPDNESNCGSAVHVARNLAQQASTILIDMADECVASEEMTQNKYTKGLKDVLSGAEQVSNCIFQDGSSKAHIMPSGLADTMLSENSANLLPVVLAALQQSYAYVVIDSGGANAHGLGLIADENSYIILSTVSQASEEVNDRIVEIRQAGFSEPIILEMH